MLSIKDSLQKDNNVRTESCQGKVSVAGLIGPQVGKSMKIGFDHDEPFEIFKVRCMGRYCKRTEIMSRISGRRQASY